MRSNSDPFRVTPWSGTYGLYVFGYEEFYAPRERKNERESQSFSYAAFCAAEKSLCPQTTPPSIETALCGNIIDT